MAAAAAVLEMEVEGRESLAESRLVDAVVLLDDAVLLSIEGHTPVQGAGIKV